MTPIEKAIEKVEVADDLLAVISDEFDVRDVSFLLSERNFHAVVVDRAPVFNRETLMHAMYQSLKFPGYFGFNWDSLKDTLAALRGTPGKQFALVFSDLGQLDPVDREKLLEVVAEANEARKPLETIRLVALKT